MANCKDCLHQCYTEATEEACNFFVDMTKYVEVVRCKDCIKCEEHYPIKEYNKCAVKAYYCLVNRCHVKPDHFCSFGEKMDGKGESE